MPHLKAYKYKKHVIGDFPVSEKVCNEIISLPLYPELSEDQVDKICKTIIDSY